jgi:hypothetical protein
MTEKEDDKVGEDFVQAWRIMDEVIGSILRGPQPRTQKRSGCHRSAT